MEEISKKTNLSILDSYSNVPIEVAAQLTGKSKEFIRQTIKDGRCPFGIGTKKEGSKSWDFLISPGMLKAWLNGTMCIQFNQIEGDKL